MGTGDADIGPPRSRFSLQIFFFTPCPGPYKRNAAYPQRLLSNHGLDGRNGG